MNVGPATVAYAGGAAAHSAAAAERLFPGAARLVALPNFAAVVDAAVGGEVGYGVLPIESSLIGPINETHDLLWESPLSIVAETSIPIRHLLAARTRLALDRITTVRSHPAALDQCRRLLASLPDARVIAAATTAAAAAEVAASGEDEAAIVSERAARMHGLEVLADDVGDHPEAYTRFVSVALHTRLDAASDGAWRTAFSFVTDHRAGALVRAIEPFARHRIDLVQLVSRPMPASPWTYRFDAVFAGHPLDPEIRAALAEVRQQARKLRVFGSYPAGA